LIIHIDIITTMICTDRSASYYDGGYDGEYDANGQKIKEGRSGTIRTEENLRISARLWIMCEEPLT